MTTHGLHHQVSRPAATTVRPSAASSAPMVSSSEAASSASAGAGFGSNGKPFLSASRCLRRDHQERMLSWISKRQRSRADTFEAKGMASNGSGVWKKTLCVSHVLYHKAPQHP